MYRHLRLQLILFALLMAGAVGCGATGLSWRALKAQIRNEFPTVDHLSVAELEQLMEKATLETTLLVDVRQPEEYAISHLPSAINMTRADAILALAQEQQVEHIVLYCSVGYRSAKMARTLSEQGWDEVANLEGSIFEWANSGRPVFQADQEVTQVHPFDSVWGQLLQQRYHPAEY